MNAKQEMEPHIQRGSPDKPLSAKALYRVTPVPDDIPLSRRVSGTPSVSSIQEESSEDVVSSLPNDTKVSPSVDTHHLPNPTEYWED